MKHITPALIILSIIAIISSTILIVYTQQANEWLVSLTPTEAYVDQPITLKVYSYSPITQQVFHVTCNLTLINSTDVVWFKRVSGAPIIYTFSIGREGSYVLEMYCIDENGNTYTANPKITIKYPAPTVTPSAYWGRPLNITIRTPYPYNNVPITLTYKYTAYTKLLVNGVAKFVGLPAIYSPETIYISLFGKVLNYTVTPQTPKLYINVTPKAFVSTATVKSVFVDKFGALPIEYPVKYTVTGDCAIQGNNFKTNETYTIVSMNKKPLEATTCTIRASTNLWRGVSVENMTEITILPINITGMGIKYTNTTPWDYRIEAYIYFDAPVYGNLTLYIDDKPVKTLVETSDAFVVQYAVEFLPGKHIVTARFTANESVVNFEPATIVVPKHPYKISPPPSRVYAGDPILVSNSYWYRYIPSNDTVVLVAYYPGDEYYAPASQVFVVKIIYPEIHLTEHSITVRNAAPGSNIKIYCIAGNSKKLIMELYSTAENYTYSIPRVISCDKVEAVYTYKSYMQIVYANEPEPVKILTTVCKAGVPCVLLDKSPNILRVEIGYYDYKPGTSIVLPAGYYTMKIYIKDGYVITVPVKVEKVAVKVVVYRDPAGEWTIDVQAPPFVKVNVVLKDGRLITLEPGTHYLFEEPVSAYWKYGEVEFIKAKLLVGFKPEG